MNIADVTQNLIVDFVRPNSETFMINVVNTLSGRLRIT
jgi:hypothetical protein